MTVTATTSSKQQGRQRPVFRRRDRSKECSRAVRPASATRIPSNAVQQVKCSDLRPTDRKGRTAGVTSPAATVAQHSLNAWSGNVPGRAAPLPYQGSAWDKRTKQKVPTTHQVLRILPTTLAYCEVIYAL